MNFTIMPVRPTLAVILLFGLLLPSRADGSDKWSKILIGSINEKGAAVFPVNVKWDFVHLTLIPKSATQPDQEVTIRVTNRSRQSISVRCGRWNEDRTGCVPNKLIHKISRDASILAYKGSLADLSKNWTDIEIQRADYGSQIDVELAVEGKSGPYQRNSIPFTVEAKWWDVGP